MYGNFELHNLKLFTMCLYIFKHLVSSFMFNLYINNNKTTTIAVNTIHLNNKR